MDEVSFDKTASCCERMHSHARRFADQVFAPQKTNLPRQTLHFCKIQAEEFKHTVSQS
jgi:hypothetical protein